MENCAQFWGAQCKKDEEEWDRSRGGLVAESGSQGIGPMSRAGRSMVGFTKQRRG